MASGMAFARVGCGAPVGEAGPGMSRALSSEVRALHDAGSEGAAAVHHDGVGTSRHAGVVGNPSGAEARLVQTTALPSGIDPLAVTVAHARVVGARTGARRTRALVLLGHAGSRARHALPRGEAAGEGRVVLELALDGARGAEAYLLVGGGLLDARGGGRTECEDEGRRRGR